MTLERIDPEELAEPQGFAHVIVATGNKMVFIAGQEPEDEHGRVTSPGDLSGQAHQVFTNLGIALAAAGARPAQVAKITIFVVRYRREHLHLIDEAKRELFGEYLPADTVVGVEALAKPDYLIEVDAVAIIDY